MIKPDFPSLADVNGEPRPDMNIKVVAFTISEKSINTNYMYDQWKESNDRTMNVTVIKFYIQWYFHLTRARGFKTCFILTQLSMEFIWLVNVNLVTIAIVGILTFISMINTIFERLKAHITLFVVILVFMSN